MRNWKRITLVIFILIGSVTFFGYWSYNQFNQAFDYLSTPYLANTNSAHISLSSKQNQNRELASTSPETLEEMATSTSSGQATSTNPELTSTSTDPELSFTFPQSGTRVYIGCTYPVSWESSSTTINSLETALIDAGTREIMGPVTSGLAKESVIEKDSQNLKWKVGVVWPGSYYIKVSKINGVEVVFRSKIFEINKMSENISTSEKEIICKGSGGSL